jgi:serine phosphatase RsbU (regulator of sigma subunit)
MLATTLVELADTLVGDFDVVELLTRLADRCVELLDVDAAGLMLVAPDGDLRVMASSSAAMRVLELFELQSQEGPCLDCYRTGEAVLNQDLTTAGDRWPRFTVEAVQAGFRSVQALPLRVRGAVIGALNLFQRESTEMTQGDLNAAQALADVATVAILQHRSEVETQLVNAQLHHALHSRIAIEQAKGVVAEREGLDLERAFARLLTHARNHHLRLADVAHEVIRGTLDTATLDDAPDPAERVRQQERVSAPGVGTLPRLEPILKMLDAAAPVDAVEVVVNAAAAMLGAEQASFLIADLSGDALIRFVRGGIEGADAPTQELEIVPMEGTPYQRALVSQSVQVVPEGHGYRLFAPVTDRGDAAGVLELVVRPRPDDALLERLRSAAHALAYVVIASRRHTDLFESVQRSAPFSLAAEIQRRLLPSAFTCEAAQFAFAGWLEPASHVGGDTFDYSVDRNALHVSMTDAMGQNVKAAQLATLALGSLRNSRRAEVSPAEQAEEANRAMVAHAQANEFVTGLLLRVDLKSGRVVAVNAGHPWPYRLRDGDVECLELDADLPFGILEASTYREQTFQLEPGDRLIVVTDGFLERNTSATDFDVAAAVAATAALHPRDVVHAFKTAVLAATGAELHDDAAVLCIDWRGPQAQSGN